MFFQKYDKNSIKKEVKKVINVTQNNNSELVEIPREKYSEFKGEEPIYMSGGIDTGEYKFNGAKIVLKEKEIPVQKISIKEEEINKEIINRKNKVKKDPKIKYEVLDKFYATTEFPGKHKIEVKKVKVQKRRHIQENQDQKYYQKNNKSYEIINKIDFKKYKNKKDGQNLNLNQIENHKKYFNNFQTYKNDEHLFENNILKNDNICLDINNIIVICKDYLNKGFFAIFKETKNVKGNNEEMINNPFVNKEFDEEDENYCLMPLLEKYNNYEEKMNANKILILINKSIYKNYTYYPYDINIINKL
jgi:hypothetical protein